MTSPARLYLLVSGCFLLLVGVVGFGLDSRFPTSSAEVAAGHGHHVFGVFATNGWHNLAAAALGLASLVVALGWPALSGAAAVVSGAANTAVFVSFAAWDPATFLVASNAADQVMHAALAIGGLLAGGWDLLAGRRLSGRARKTFLVLHIVAGAVWFGIDLALGILVVTALVTDDPGTAGMAVRAVELFAIWPMFAASLLCLGAGIVLAVGSRYGLLRYWWVAVKFGVTVLMSTLIVVSLRPGIAEAASIGERLIAGDTTATVPNALLFPVFVAPTLLLTAYLLSVFKPWGRIQRQRRTTGPSAQPEHDRALIGA